MPPVVIPAGGAGYKASASHARISIGHSGGSRSRCWTRWPTCTCTSPRSRSGVWRSMARAARLTTCHPDICSGDAILHAAGGGMTDMHGNVRPRPLHGQSFTLRSRSATRTRTIPSIRWGCWPQSVFAMDAPTLITCQVARQARCVSVRPAPGVRPAARPGSLAAHACTASLHQTHTLLLQPSRHGDPRQQRRAAHHRNALQPVCCRHNGAVGMVAHRC